MNSNKSNAHRRDLGWISGDPLGFAEITDLTIKADAEWVKKRMDEVWLGSAVYWRILAIDVI